MRMFADIKPIPAGALEGTILAVASSQGQLSVGIPKDAVYQRNGKRIPLWFVALVNEFGTEDGRIPARPALTWAFDRHGPSWQRSLMARAQQVVRGRLTLDQAVARTGAKMVQDIENAYHRMTSPKSAESTVRKKEASGSPTPNKPLHDTGRLAKAWRWAWLSTAPAVRSLGIAKGFSDLRMSFRSGTKI